MGKSMAALGGLVGIALTVGVIAWIVLGSSGSTASPGAAGGPSSTGSGYLGSAVAGKAFAEKTIWQAQVQAAIGIYETVNGSFPESLDDLGDEVPELSEGWEWDYDPDTGTVQILRTQ